jgi:hypothetical protein
MESSHEPGAGVFRVGVTGHRTLSDPQVVERQCRTLLQRVHAEHPSVVACAALAVGADTIFAEVALALGIPLEGVIPFATYVEDFVAVEERAGYERLAARATIIRLPFGERSNDAYLAAGKWIVDHAQLLVAVWDGAAGRGPGGTADIVRYARERGLELHHIPAERPPAGAARE